MTSSETTFNDEELIESLRLWNRDDAADRIEQLAVTNEALIAERDEAWKRAAHSEKMWGEAEVKLAKAAGVIEWALISWDDHNKHGYNMQGDWVFDARATLAEISSEAALNKGESHE